MSLTLGTQTNSVINHLQSRATIGQPAPVVGMGVTFLSWTDRSAGTIFRTWTEGKFVYIETRRDKSVVVAGSTQDGSANYEFRANPSGSKSFFRRLKDDADGAWTGCLKGESGRWKKTGGGLRIGERDEYRDPSF